MSAARLAPVEYHYAVDEAWRRMRALRHKPPNHASAGERKLLFSAATKQSEQFFKYADAAGYEIKPILLYYGLNQAGRAIAASMAEAGQKWELQGHGITCRNLDDDSLLGELIVVNQNRPGAFEALADILHSPTLPQKVPLRDIWMSLPEGTTVPLQGTEEVWSAAKLKRADGQRSLLAQLAAYPWDQFKPVATLSHLPYLLAPLGIETAEELLTERYPMLRNFIPTWDGPGNTLDFGWSPAERLSLRLAYYPGEAVQQEFAVTGLDVMQCGMHGYADLTEVSTWVIPVVGHNSEPLHPLMTWWVVLYGLSMLARYKPSNWTRLLDIDVSPDAPAIEFLLDEAHRACVNLIMEIFEVWQLQHGGPTPKGLQEAIRLRRESFSRLDMDMDKIVAMYRQRVEESIEERGT